MKNLKALLVVVMVMVAAQLTGCGSGGGGGANEPASGDEITYPGATTQAKITVDNANDIFSVIWSGGTSPATGEKAPAKGLHAPGAISIGRIIPYPFRVSDVVNHYIGGEKAKSIAAPKEINETNNGSVSGTLTKTGNIDEDTGTGTLTMTYSNYNDGGQTNDGVLTAKVDAYDVSYKIITDMTLSFTLWTIKDKGRSISASGSVRVQESLSNNTETQTYNVIIRDNNTNETSKQENFVLATTYNNIFTPSSKTETASGRVYIEKYGYVDISTVSPFIYSAYPQDNPDKGGPVFLSGAGNSKAGMTSISTSKVRIEMDTDGDGTFESKNIYSWDDLAGEPVAPDTTAPTILSTSPANAAIGVAINTAIEASFSEPMDPATVTIAEFTLMNGATPVSGAVTCSGTIAAFTPAVPLYYNTLYTVTITTGAKDLAGNQMSTNYSWTFTTGTAPDTTPPTVSSTSPANNATGVTVNGAISATFSEAMNAATISTVTFTVAGVTGTVTYSGSTATFTPTAPLAYNTLYTATITTGVKDQAGNQMFTNYSWTFKTGAVPFTPNPSPLPPLNQSVAYQIDYAHSGHVAFGTPITFPGSATWSVTLNGAVSYPLIAGGKVFVTTAGLGTGYGTQLYALDKQTGHIAWGPVAIAGTYFWSAHAYDHGKVFVISFDGLLKSFDAATGQAGWSTKLPEHWVDSPPTAVNGIVYVGSQSSGILYAVDESNGNVLWTTAVNGGGISSPAVSSDGVFVSYPCQVYKFDPLTGASLWHYSGGCSGGGGKTAAYANSLLYVRDFTSSPPGQIFDAATGTQAGNFKATSPTPIPAFTKQTGFLQNAGTLQGIDLGTHNVLWSFAGDGKLTSAPIVIDQVAIVGSSSGNVYAVDIVTGSQIWSGYAGAPIAGPDEQNVSQPLTGFGAGEGYLVVPAGNVLSAWHISGP